ncbi:unnamed protein product, partial [marine sediment metagenome]
FATHTFIHKRLEEHVMNEKKIRKVTIRYSYDTDEWDHIEVSYEDANCSVVTREQIDTFKRMHKIVKDLQEVEKLRDELISIFGSKTRIGPTQEP